MLQLIHSGKESTCHSGAVMASLLGREGEGVVEELLALARANLARCREQVVASAWSSPLHGVLTATRHCLTSLHTEEQVEEVLVLVEEVVELMVGILSGRQGGVEANPDFQQMAEAIARLVEGGVGE